MTHEMLNVGDYQELETGFDRVREIFWCYMKPKAAPCFTLGLLNDLLTMMTRLEKTYQTHPNDGAPPFHYFVLSSRIPADIYNYGGDLGLFAKLIRNKDRQGLFDYAKLCIDIIYRIVINFNLPVTTIALVKGDALGGGFEVALPNDVIIAEKKAKFGVPEIRFGLFPGMGAYSFLARRLGKAQAEKMLYTGAIYSAEEACAMGLIDMVVENGQGERGLYDFIGQRTKRYHSYRNLYKIRNRVDPVTYGELIDITTLWVDAALMLDGSDLRRMERLASTQLRKWQKPDITSLPS